jgi:hypothetical protein
MTAYLEECHKVDSSMQELAARLMRVVHECQTFRCAVRGR